MELKFGDIKKMDKCCGGCNHFKYEITDGSGWCEKGDTKTYCGFGTDCNDFEDVETIRRERVASKEHERHGKSSCRNRR